MSKKDRSINIFNLSFLDLLSCGLGALILLMVLWMSMANTISMLEPQKKSHKQKTGQTSKTLDPLFIIIE